MTSELELWRRDSALNPLYRLLRSLVRLLWRAPVTEPATGSEHVSAGFTGNCTE